MLGKRIRDCKNAAAPPERGHHYCPRAGQSGESMVEEGEVCARYGAVPLRQGFKRRIEAGAQVELASDVAKLDDLVTHRERRHELRALQWLGRVRYSIALA
jgi:hypothetical protein